MHKVLLSEKEQREIGWETSAKKLTHNLILAGKLKDGPRDLDALNYPYQFLREMKFLENEFAKLPTINSSVVDRYKDNILPKFPKEFHLFIIDAIIKLLEAFPHINKIDLSSFQDKNALQNAQNPKMIIKNSTAINAIYNTLTPFFDVSDYPKLKDLLSGKDIEGTIDFKGKAGQFPDLWGRIKRDTFGYTSTGPEEIKKWILKYFTVNGEPYKPGTVKGCYSIKRKVPNNRIASDLFPG